MIYIICIYIYIIVCFIYIYIIYGFVFSALANVKSFKQGWDLKTLSRPPKQPPHFLSFEERGTNNTPPPEIFETHPYPRRYISQIIPTGGNLGEVPTFKMTFDADPLQPK